MRLLGPIVGALIFLLPACRGDGSDRPPGDPAHADEAVCQTLSALDDGLETGRKSFMDGPHQSLHEVARRLLEAEERSAAGDLLEAKQSVESALEKGLQKESVEDSLLALHQATQSALEVLGETTSKCPQVEP